jgi:excisionase family DNA binding protein
MSSIRREWNRFAIFTVVSVMAVTFLFHIVVRTHLNVTLEVMRTFNCSACSISFSEGNRDLSHPVEKLWSTDLAHTNCQRELITANEFAELLSVSEGTLYRLKSVGRLPPSIALGGSVRWRLAEVRDWIARGCPPMPNSKYSNIKISIGEAKNSNGKRLQKNIG